MLEMKLYCPLLGENVILGIQMRIVGRLKFKNTSKSTFPCSILSSSVGKRKSYVHKWKDGSISSNKSRGTSKNRERMQNNPKVNFMDEQTIKVLARFTEIGQLWPDGAWVHNTDMISGHIYIKWFQIKKEHDTDFKTRIPSEISEAEANQRGIFRRVRRCIKRAI